jgi:hypothetical protein
MFGSFSQRVLGDGVVVAEFTDAPGLVACHQQRALGEFVLAMTAQHARRGASILGPGSIIVPKSYYC